MKRKCVVCQSEYDYCPHCGKDANKPRWMFAFCSEKCKVGLDVLTRFGAKELTVEQASEALKGYDYGVLSQYSESTQKLLEEIKTYEESLKEKEKVKEKPKKRKAFSKNESVDCEFN